MDTHRVLTGITTALFSAIILGCAGPAANPGLGSENGSLAPALTTGLCGTWQGEFSYIGSDHQSSPGSLDLMLEVSGDSTYTLKWGNHRPSTGTVIARENRLILEDESGSRITLVRSGDTLYGVTKDQVDGRPTMLNLAKQDSAPSLFAGTSPRC